MTLLTAHKILIAGAVVLFALYGATEVRNYSNGDAGALLRAAAAGIVAVGLAVYLRWVWRRRSVPTPRG